MSISVGNSPGPWPNIMNMKMMNSPQRVGKCELPADMSRLRCDPFVRLSCIPTKSSTFKKCGNPCAPQDHLDIALTACYDHHRQWWAPRAQTVMQCATYRLFPWGRAQQRVCRLKAAGNQEQLMVNHEPYRNEVSHMDTSIASPHISNTNRGYGRAIDGLFFNS